jgi:photosynthetic reaction center H subunit
MNNMDLRRLSEVDEYEVAKDDPDVRGWDVVAHDGREIGEVDDLIIDSSAMKVRYLDVELDTGTFNLREGRHVAVPIEAAQLDRNRKQVYISGIAVEDIGTLPPFQGRIEGDYNQRFRATPLPSAQRRGNDVRLTRAEEELRISKRAVEAGEVRVGKHVETEHVREPVTKYRERVHVDRRPVEPGQAAGDVRIQEDEIRVPVTEEQVVVEKRPVVKEELVISKEREEVTETVDADLRKERFDLEETGRAADSDVTDRPPSPKQQKG